MADLSNTEAQGGGDGGPHMWMLMTGTPLSWDILLK